MNHRYAQPPPLDLKDRQWPANQITRAPVWCAVDLRDGNQALPNPMTPKQKRRYFQILTEIGFKEIEIGFPSASADDFQFCRDLIEEDLIPDDVTISVLTQARDHLIKRTMEALKGARQAICHVYIASSELHMRYVFKKTAAETQQTAVDAVRMIRDESQKLTGSTIRLEFSPEEFTDTDLDFAVELCDSVVETWAPTPGEKVILNLPATVERRPPNQYADMIEAFIKKQQQRDSSVISIHSHNDMGCAVAASEMTLLAGADRIEGTLFGHGERSGNVDLVTLALNLQYLGLDTGLDFSRIEHIRDELVDLTSMPVHARHPYAGELVFTAFSGSHQDAIHKGLTNIEAMREHFGGWKIPYLLIDPRDIGRSFEKFIRINSQSGKGGIAHILQAEYGVKLPRTLLLDFSRHVQSLADRSAREVNATEVWNLFKNIYARQDGPVQLLNYWPHPNADDPSQIDGEVHVKYQGKRHELKASGSGPISAFARALRQLPLPTFSLEEYEEDAIGKSADAEAVAYVRLDNDEQKSSFGVGFGPNIDQAAVRAIVAALNGFARQEAQS
ncbi:MAG: 2-isopropylmalate synthase [Candidatus Pacebacteria bacterium]|nr:2-isopropylmalate synthase [Candidatus Paceibacterota bacterium]